MDVIALQTEMRNHLVDTIIELVLPFAVIIHDFVRRGLWVSDDQSSVDAEVELGLSETGIFGDILGFIVLLFVDHVDFGLVGHFWFFGGFLDTENVLV